MTQVKYPALPVLLVDDEESWLRGFRYTLRAGGISNVETIQDSREVMPFLSHQPVSAVVSDINMPHLSGQDLLDEIMEHSPGLPVIIITAFDQVDLAVQCLKAGAYDFFVKTSAPDRLVSGIRNAIRMGELRRENALLKQRVLLGSLEHPEVFEPIVTQSENMRAMFQYVEAISRSQEPVLITGETGTGKELIAGAVHQLSQRPGRFVAINTAGLDDNVFTDTLFGHRKGAFTGAQEARKGLIESAAGGTLFMDEIGDLNMASQVKLLRLLQEKEYLPLGSDDPSRCDARIIAATHHELEAKRDAGEFRKDLYYRLQTHRIHIPALRERSEDIPLLLDCFLDEAARELEKKKPTPPKELVSLLRTYSFPGNVRELRAMVFDAMSQHKSKMLSMDVFRERIGAPDVEVVDKPEAEKAEECAISISGAFPTLREATRYLIDEAMRRAEGNQGIAAQMLGISRQALNQRLRQIDKEEETSHGTSSLT